MSEISKLFAPVTALLTNFVREINPEYSVALGADFAANMDEDCIYFAVAVAQASSDAFVENFVARFPECECFDMFLLSFMHELGHLETEWDMVDDTDLREEIMDNETYFDLYNERIATDWAGEYLTDHLEEMKVLNDQILKTLCEIWQEIPD